MQKWALAFPELGGFKEAEPKNSAKECLLRLLEPVIDLPDPVVVKLSLVEEWACPWPKPAQTFVPGLTLMIFKGVIDWRPLRDVVADNDRRGRANVEMKWWHWLCSTGVAEHIFQQGLVCSFRQVHIAGNAVH